MQQTILIVDDEANILLSLEFILKQAGFIVHTAMDGEAALEAVERYKPDLLLLDVMMPRRDGFDVCQTLRRSPSHHHLNIIMLTAKGREVEREKGLALGADDYIIKPFAIQEVLAKVTELLAEDLPVTH